MSRALNRWMGQTLSLAEVDINALRDLSDVLLFPLPQPIMLDSIFETINIRDVSDLQGMVHRWWYNSLDRLLLLDCHFTRTFDLVDDIIAEDVDLRRDHCRLVWVVFDWTNLSRSWQYFSTRLSIFLSQWIGRIRPDWEDCLTLGIDEVLEAFQLLCLVNDSDRSLSQQPCFRYLGLEVISWGRKAI